LRLLALSSDAECRVEIDTALETTMTALSTMLTPGQGNFSLCHGVAGNTDFVYTASLQLDRPELCRNVMDVAQYGIAQYHVNDIPWPCGVHGAGETPNLMMGLAGIGYFYLRLHAPTIVPSVLVLRAQEAGTNNSFDLREEWTHAIANH
jgi:lantibiotic modifying enzyme